MCSQQTVAQFCTLTLNLVNYFFAVQKLLCVHASSRVCVCLSVFVSSQTHAKCAWRSEANTSQPSLLPTSFSVSLSWTWSPSGWLHRLALHSTHPPVSAFTDMCFCYQLFGFFFTCMLGVWYLHKRHLPNWPSPQNLHRALWSHEAPSDNRQPYFQNNWSPNQKVLNSPQLCQILHSFRIYRLPWRNLIHLELSRVRDKDLPHTGIK